MCYRFKGGVFGIGKSTAKQINKDNDITVR